MQERPIPKDKGNQPAAIAFLEADSKAIRGGADPLFDVGADACAPAGDSRHCCGAHSRSSGYIAEVSLLCLRLRFQNALPRPRVIRAIWKSPRRHAMRARGTSTRGGRALLLDLCERLHDTFEILLVSLKG